MTSRRGTSLIELLVVITASMIVVGLAVGIVRTLVSANRAAEGHLVRSESAGRLCESFRRQVRAAREAEPIEPDGATRLELSFEDGRQIEFRCVDHEIIRTERVAGVDRRREVYTLANDSAARFEIQRDDDRTTVTLVIARTSRRDDEGRSREFRAEATLARDHRFVPKGE